MDKTQNTFAAFLAQLEVKHTGKFTEQNFNEHPNKNNLFGLSAKHNAWKEKIQLRGTPTVLVNGYQLPESYKIEDLQYFTDLEL